MTQELRTCQALPLLSSLGSGIPAELRHSDMGREMMKADVRGIESSSPDSQLMDFLVLCVSLLESIMLCVCDISAPSCGNDCVLTEPRGFG